MLTPENQLTIYNNSNNIIRGKNEKADLNMAKTKFSRNVSVTTDLNRENDWGIRYFFKDSLLVGAIDIESRKVLSENKHNSFSKNIDVVEKYKNNIRENLHNYFKNKSDCFSEVSYKLITEDSYDMENHLKSINDKLLSNHIKDIWYKSLITNYIATKNDYIRFDRKGDINLNDDEELVIPVSLATLYISYPYYGLLGITKNSEGCFTPGVCGRNISNNFLSGNIGVHLDSFASIYYHGEYSFNTIDYENYNLVDIYKGDDSFSSLLENCVDNADDAENYTMEETYTRDEVLENTKYFNMVLNNGLIYSTKVCLGSNAKNISESDCLSNMNMDSMFNSFTLSDHWIEEAIASQEIAK